VKPLWKQVLSAAGRHVFDTPTDRVDYPIVEGQAPVWNEARPLRVVSWNLQFGAGRGQRFFYDGGKAVSVDAATVHRTLDGIAAVLRSLQPDVVLLQEVDRGSRRTAFIDEHQELLRRLPFASHTSTPYHRCRYLPHPAHEPLGRVNMHLSVFSNFSLLFARRHPLAALAEPPWRRLFNLRRCILEVHLQRPTAPAWVLFNTHFSAFARGDGTLARQVAQSIAVVDQAEEEGHPWVFAGDLNALPPGDDPQRLPDPHEYPEAHTPLMPLFERYPAPSADLLDPRWRTYLPPDAETPDRVLDYAFAGSRAHILDYRVVRDPASHLSDHLPVVTEVEFTG
jgi:endonuclease/exonuclease/phosphatase family metal-dependent hydrolase